MPKFMCDDGNADVEIEADSAREAAQAYVDGGDFTGEDETVWVAVYVEQVLGEDDDGDILGERACITIAVDPAEPDCDEAEHEWRSPLSVVGGYDTNPGVWSHGGGYIIIEACVHCGCYRETDTWASNRDTGEQGLTSVTYRAADAFSREP